MREIAPLVGILGVLLSLDAMASAQFASTASSECKFLGTLQVLDEVPAMKKEQEAELLHRAELMGGDTVVMGEEPRVFRCTTAQPEALPLRTSPLSLDLDEGRCVFFGFDLGLGYAAYPGNDRTGMNLARTVPGATNITAQADLTLHYRLGQSKSLLGVALVFVGDGMESKDAGTYANQLTLILGPSFEKFYGTRIGDGWFWRGDFGWGYSTFGQGLIADQSSFKSAYADSGVGGALTGGYGFYVQSPAIAWFAARLLLYLQINAVVAHGAWTQNTGVGFGMMF